MAVWTIITAVVCGALAAGGWWLFRRWLKRHDALLVHSAQKLSWDDGFNEGWSSAIQGNNRKFRKRRMRDEIAKKAFELYVERVSRYSTDVALPDYKETAAAMLTQVDAFVEALLEYMDESDKQEGHP